MFIQTILVVVVLLFFPASVYAEEDGGQFLACDMPVLEYTTGESDEISENLYSGSVEWVIVEVFPIKQRVLGSGYDGWVVLVEPAADGDESLEDFIEDPEGLAQVKFDGRWIRQYDFERLWCDKKPDVKYFIGGPTRTAFRFVCYSTTMQKYVVLDKKVGQTPLQCSDLYKESHPELTNVPMTYAGRLDPMASGKLLILLGDECKNQTAYRNLNKEYEFEVLFGMHSDTADVLGRLTESSRSNLELSLSLVNTAVSTLTGEIELPYPHFSSKTVQGKALHTWTLEGRITEIKIPTKKSIIHSLKCKGVYTQTRTEVHGYATEKIETIPPVTELRKAIGNDFRRADVRKDWKKFMETGSPDDTFYIAKLTCIASSGTYMRTLSEVIAKELSTSGLAYSIHRTKIGTYKKLPLLGGVWIKLYK